MRDGVAICYTAFGRGHAAGKRFAVVRRIERLRCTGAYDVCVLTIASEAKAVKNCPRARMLPPIA
jgi:hypothetical protein